MDFSQALSIRIDAVEVRVRFQPHGPLYASYAVYKKRNLADLTLLCPIRILINQTMQFHMSLQAADTLGHILTALVTIGAFLDAYLIRVPIGDADKDLILSVAAKYLHPVFDAMHPQE